MGAAVEATGTGCELTPQVLVVSGMVWGEDLGREFAERCFIARVVDV